MKPELRRVQINLPDLPPELEGMTICQLSDLHRGPLVPERLLKKGVDLACQAQADLIVITGDFVSASWKYAPSCAKILSLLRAPLGVYATLGNHDHWEGKHKITYYLERAGVQVLCNRSIPMEFKGRRWWLSGLDDIIAGNPNLAKTLVGIPDNEFKVLLCHEPDYIMESSKHGFSLQLSGHSHGGQINLRGIGPLILPEQGTTFPQGLNRYRNSYVYTNVGLGVVTLPLRHNCPPEVTLFTLKRLAC